MSLAWPMLAAVGAAGATWLYEWSPARNPPDSDVRSCNLPLPLILEMLSVAIRQGASIPRALIAVGNIVEGEFGGGLRSAGERLNSGMPWNEAWPDDDDCAVVRDAFSSSWSSGSSPVNRLATAIEQLDWDERSRIEQSAAKLSISVAADSPWGSAGWCELAQICSNRTAVGMTDDARSVPSCPNRLWISVDDTPRVWITHILRPQVPFRLEPMCGFVFQSAV